MQVQSENTQAVVESYIRSHNHEGLSRLAQFDPSSWAGSVQQELKKFSTKPDLASDFLSFPAYMGCAAILMLEGDDDIVFANLTWLYGIGLRRLIVIFDLAEDAERKEVSRFRRSRPDMQVVVIENLLGANQQNEAISAACRLALELWPEVDWFLPFYANEFCIARNGLEMLRTVPQNVEALTVPKVVHFREAGDRSFSANPLAQMSVRSELFVLPPRIIVRARRYSTIWHSSHQVCRVNRTEAIYTGGFQFGFFHREFRTRSFDQLLRKIRKLGRTSLLAHAAERTIDGCSILVWYQILKELGESELERIYEADRFRRSGQNYVSDQFCWRV